MFFNFILENLIHTCCNRTLLQHRKICRRNNGKDLCCFLNIQLLLVLSDHSDSIESAVWHTGEVDDDGVIADVGLDGLFEPGDDV